VRGDAQDVHAAGLDLHHEEHVQVCTASAPRWQLPKAMIRSAILTATLGAASFDPALIPLEWVLAVLAFIALVAVFAPEKYR
jgi:hypothetical protein